MKQTIVSVEQTWKHGKDASPVNIENAKLPPGPAKSHYGKWRALSLFLVYLLIVVHIIHWKVAGKTMAPLELSEVMKVLELRVITAGAIFIGLMFLGTAVCGRFFCSWACHMLAVQDLSHWILEKLGIRPRPIRSRILLLVPVLPACYVFVYPVLRGWWQGHTPKTFSTRLVTTDLWHDLPGPLVAGLTFLICGFLIVYVLGGRAFCTYGCPYGVLFGVFSRIAPGKIRARDGCVQCGTCTATCTSGVRVHEEVQAYGMVVNRHCMKDLDCVSVCPQNVLHFGFRGKPGSAARGGSGVRRLTRRYNFTWAEELLMAGVFALAFCIFYGLYRMVPFFLAVGLGVITAYAVLLLVRLFYAPTVKLQRLRLKEVLRITPLGWTFAGSMGFFLLFLGHSAFIQWHFQRGGDYFDQAADARFEGDLDGARKAMDTSLEHLSICDRSGLVHTRGLGRMLGELFRWNNDLEQAVLHFTKDLEASTRNPTVPILMGATLTELGRPEEGKEYYRKELRRRVSSADHYVHMAAALEQQLEFAAQMQVLRAGIEAYPGDETLIKTLCAALVACPDETLRDLPEALRRADELCAATGRQNADVLAMVAWVYSEAGRHEDAVATAQEALEVGSAQGLTDLVADMVEMKNWYRERVGHSPR